MLIKKLSVKLTALLVLGTLLMSGLGLVTPQPVYAADSKAAACAGIGLAGAGGCDAGDDAVNKVIKTVVNVLTWVVGIAAVIMIIVSGFRYITSGGEASNVSAAKSSLIYALVGIVIVALAQFIVHFVLGQVK
ncbi:hypothetical protein BH09PAT3_BH09PAT3_3220 [soil metagenome]